MATTTTDSEALDELAAMLGSHDEWRSAADWLEAIANLVATTGRPHPGDPANRNRYRDQADRLGIGHDGDDDARECANCGDAVHVLSSRDWCDGCEADDRPACTRCGTTGYPLSLRGCVNCEAGE